MREPSYFFQSLESIYYFRMRVPTDLQQIFKRTELKKSLRTRSKAVALRRCRQYVAAAEQVFESLRLSHFKAELTGTHPTRQSVEFTASEQLDSPPTIRDREKELWNKVFQADASVENVVVSPPALVPALDPMPVSTIPLTPPIISASQRISLSELIRLYIAEVTDQRGRDISKGIEKNLLRFMEIVTDKPINCYTVEDKQRYREILQQMPKCVNRTQYHGRTIEDIIKTKLTAHELLAIKTVNMRLIEVATMFNWAVNNGLVDSHSFKNAVLKIQKSDDDERPAVSDADIKTIIENLPRVETEPSMYWVPLLACFTGMRQSEIAQLDGDDIVDMNGTWCIDINDRGDKRLKNSNAKRTVPLHPVLIDSGLIAFAEARRGLKLFEDVKPYNGKYGHQVSKEFAKYRAAIGVEGDGQTFHGIRHSVITKLWAAGIPEAHTAAVVGHQRGERESYTRYAKKTDLRPLLAAIEAIDYGEIKLRDWSAE